MIGYFNDNIFLYINLNQLLQNNGFLLNLIPALVGAFLGFILAKWRDKKAEKKAYNNIADALILELENNQRLISDYYDQEKVHWDRKKTFKGPISVEVYKTFQSSPFIYNYTTKDFLKKLNIFYTELRKFKNTEDGSEANKFIDIDKDNYQDKFKNMIKEVKKIQE